MRTISVWIYLVAIIAMAVPQLHAQDAATQAQLDKITGEIQDVQDSLAQQDKRLTALEQKINDLQEKSSQPGGNDYASADDLKKLAEKVQEIEKKREEDNKAILDALEKLGKGGGGSHHSSPNNPLPTPLPTTGDNLQQGTTGTPGSSGPQQGFYYKIAPDNTLSAIAKAYRAQGVKVSVDDILKANPGLNPNKLVVGQKIFIPAPQ